MIKLKNEDELNDLEKEMTKNMTYCPYCNKKQSVISPPLRIVHEGFFDVKYGFHFKQRCLECNNVYEMKKML